MLLLLTRAQWCLTLCNPWTLACQAPLFMGFFQARTSEWVAISSSRGILPTQGLNPSLASAALAGRFFTTSAKRVFQSMNL